MATRKHKCILSTKWVGSLLLMIKDPGNLHTFLDRRNNSETCFITPSCEILLQSWSNPKRNLVLKAKVVMSHRLVAHRTKYSDTCKRLGSKHLWRRRDIRPSIKDPAFIGAVRSVLLFFSETLSLRRYPFKHRFLRSIVKFWWENYKVYTKEK